jgi:hypothetical protein
MPEVNTPQTDKSLPNLVTLIFSDMTNGVLRQSQ